MTARVLVVDDILANVRLLEAKLTAEYFDVLTAMNGVDALEMVKRNNPDIVLLDVMMPGMDGIEVCRRIKNNPATQHIPVVMVTALDQPEDRVRGLEAGADDFLTKPVNDMALFCRVKSLVRLKMLTDELRSRSAAGEEMGLVPQMDAADAPQRPGNILIIDDRGHLAERIRSGLDKAHSLDCAYDPQQALFQAAENPYDLLIINLDLEGFDGLRLCSQLRSLERTRQIPILIIVDPDDHQRMLRAMDMGVNDYLMRPIDKQELLARVSTQIKRWRFTEKLRTNVQQSIELAVTDPLTGLYNRRYMTTQANILVDNASSRGKALSVLSLDVDFFKAVNDQHGHDAGDQVLRELAARIRASIRNVDLACRVGGEEFVLLLPETQMDVAYRVAERIRKAVGSKPFEIKGGNGARLSVTISVGVAGFEDPSESIDEILKRSDDALYRAKRDGRNKVISVAA